MSTMHQRRNCFYQTHEVGWWHNNVCTQIKEKYFSYKLFLAFSFCCRYLGLLFAEVKRFRDPEVFVPFLVSRSRKISSSFSDEHSFSFSFKDAVWKVTKCCDVKISVQFNPQQYDDFSITKIVMNARVHWEKAYLGLIIESNHNLKNSICLENLTFYINSFRPKEIERFLLH